MKDFLFWKSNCFSLMQLCASVYYLLRYIYSLILVRTTNACYAILWTHALNTGSTYTIGKDILPQVDTVTGKLGLARNERNISIAARKMELREIDYDAVGKQ